MSYQYTYLLLAVIFLPIWFALFIWRKDNRQEMLIMSLIFSVAGPLANIVYVIDWWSPMTITETPVGVECVLAGFMIGGIASVLYGNIFRKKLKIREVSEKKEEKRDSTLFFILLSVAIIFLGSFYILNLNSLYATILCLLLPTIFIWIKRKDLILNSFLSGILLVIVAMVVYGVLDLITPGWVSAFWFFENVPDLIILNLPIDDIIWYFLAGMFIGPLYEFWKEAKLKKV